MKRRLLVLALIGLAVAGSAHSDMINVILTTFELSWEQQQNLERAACLKPYNLRLHASYGDGSEEDSEFRAHALCATHRYIESNAVAYEVYCDVTQSDWKCALAREVIDATFPDRRIFIESHNATLEDSYAVVAHFVAAKAFEPGTYSTDSFDRTDGAHDGCVVSGHGADTFLVECQRFSARVKRDVSSGTAKYVRMAAP